MFNPINFSPWQWLLVPMIIYVRYLLFAFVFYFVFYIWKRRAWFYRKIQQRWPKSADYRREIGYSTLASLIFGAAAFICLGTPLRQYTQFYSRIDEYGLGWLLLSVPLTLLIHDAYFYWMHRLIHHRKIYPWVHRVHHLSVNPSPWAAFAFHPLESLGEAAIIPILLFGMPLHPVSFFSFVMIMMLFNVYGHLGFELFSPKTYTHPIGKWLNTSAYHNLHHEKFTGNYGLYFTFWDRICGTLREESLEKALEIHHRRPEEVTKSPELAH